MKMISNILNKKMKSLKNVKKNFMIKIQNSVEKKMEIKSMIRKIRCRNSHIKKVKKRMKTVNNIRNHLILRSKVIIIT
jgi:hypothetical protein